ncbi:hypothetical protein [Akkermansia muciniphila]|uniref:hypothetical protein n=1 Tax=Akkermansia muciniphila TaxID=239935 RepID=UPI0027D2E880|nr:hypothetical protein [Akkermansia muciniphila]WMB16246.1 hypothetical protein O4G22_04950 [Akkermansia muciniphila]
MPGASASAYTHWMVTNGTDFAGRADVGGLGAGGRYLKGARIRGLAATGRQDPLVHYKHEQGCISACGRGRHYRGNRRRGTADFGIARLRVTADQVRHVAEGRSLYVGNDDDARPGDYISLTSENDVPRRATVTGGGAVR